MIGLISEGLGLAKAVAQYFVAKEGTKYVDQIVSLEKKIADVLSSWPNIDDQKLAELLQEKRSIEHALANQIQVAIASRS